MDDNPVGCCGRVNRHASGIRDTHKEKNVSGHSTWLFVILMVPTYYSIILIPAGSVQNPKEIAFSDKKRNTKSLI